MIGAKNLIKFTLKRDQFPQSARLRRRPSTTAGKQRYRSEGPPVRVASEAGPGPNFDPGWVRIPTKRRFFPVYQKRPADITIAGTATES